MTATQTMSKTVSDAFDDLRSQAGDAAQEARRDVSKTLRELPYAMLGSLSLGMRRGRRVLKGAFELPGRTIDAARHAPERLSEAYSERVDAGHEAFDRARGRKSVRRARSQARSAGSAAKGATTTAGRAAKAAARAASDAAQAVEPADSRPYEERTVEELYELAASRQIEGRSQMNKGELIAALRDR